jgi:choline dehydrogenase-like flavoprotein
MQSGHKRVIRARREVIVCAGAFQSPQLLMVSGVGPGAHLQQHGIEVLHDLPGVGQNLQDHPDFIFGYAAKSLDLMGISLGGTVHLAKEALKYMRSRQGFVGTNYAEAGGFLKTEPTLAVPDVQLHFVMALVDDHARKLRTSHGFSCHVCLLRPKSRGQVTLATADARQAPLIDPAFLAHDDDLETLVKGFKLTQRLMNTAALTRVRHNDVFTSHVKTDDDIRQALRNRSDTVYHPVGTCKMGTDAMAVLDPQLKVQGLEGLRVVDASAMPTLIGANTNATVIAMAEKAVDMVRQT